MPLSDILHLDKRGDNVVLYLDKNYVTNSAYPDTDFMGDADYVIPDGSEIAEKIIALYPNFDFVFNDSSDIADILEIEPDLTGIKAKKIEESKISLARWLETNPYEHTDGNKYSCTEEKQSLLNSNLASYERAIAAGVEYPLKWNSSGCECIPWKYDELRNLSLCIAAYVAPKVSKQQSLEIKIKSCTTLDEINSVEICYDD